MEMQTPEIANEIPSWSGLSEERQTKERQTVMLVEDEDFVRRAACEILCDAGYAVLTAKKANEALLVYEQQHGNVGLVLTDVVLPGENGHALARKIRRINPSIKVLFMTGYAEQMERELSGHEKFLAKPFASAELLWRVARLLEADAGDDKIQTAED
jgi:two-component system, cell cycle sensor histidine kinase and response regulator CckA